MNVEIERVGNAKHISDEGVKLLGRVDHFEINEDKREIHVKDDFGIYILYECAMQDMKDLEDELLKIGSHYISKHEYLVNTEIEKAYPLVDRITLLEDLLNQELDFQFQKVLLIQTYVEAYEHISDPLEQQRLIQVVVDIMAQRPRLNLQASYFIDSYEIEKKCVQKHTALMRTMIVNQMTIEKTENKKMQAYLDLTLRMTQEHEKGKWKYADAEDFFNDLKRRKMESAMNQQEEQNQNKRKSNLSVPSGHGHYQNLGGDEDQSSVSEKGGSGAPLSATQKFMQKQVEKNHASKYSKEHQGPAQSSKGGAGGEGSQLSHKESEGGFAAVLGLPTITVETLYQQYKEKDEVILDIMNEHVNYIKHYEGYPDMLIDLQALQSSKLSNYKFTDWSQPINVLDFYQSLSFAPKFYSTLQSIITELQEVHKPHNLSMLAMIEFKILERAEIEYQKCKAFIDGDLKEYKGQEYLEEEAIVGNPDKLNFHVRDMMSNLNKSAKNNLNPFIVGKLDIDTIAHFDFPSQPKESNQYLKQLPTLQRDFEIASKIAESNTKAGTAAQSRYFSQLKEYMRKINVPQGLTLYCNTIEMLRLREELIAALSESMVLQEIYEAQAKLVNRPNFRPFFTDSVKFDNYLIDQQKVNFIDDGPGSFLELDLAIREYDAVLKSNINFRNPDAVKLLINTSGLEELRGILHYQLMHKQLLIIGTRLNQTMIDIHQRALGELELARRGIGVPNSVIQYSALFCKSGDGFNNEQYNSIKARYNGNMTSEVANVFFQITQKKAKNRSIVSKKFLQQLQQTAGLHRKVETCLRIMRAYKLKLLHAYCSDVMRDAYFDAVKIQAITTCQKLRTMAQVFNIDEHVVGVLNFPEGKEEAQVFKFEDQIIMENFFSAYNPAHKVDNTQHRGAFGSKAADFSSTQHPKSGAKAINSQKHEIIDYSIIPSTYTLVNLDTLTTEEQNELTEKFSILSEHKSGGTSKADVVDLKQLQEIHDKEHEFDNCDKVVKQAIPKLEFVEPEYTSSGDGDRVCLTSSDFKQSYDYTGTLYGQVFSFYALLERVFKFELSMTKINTSLYDTLQLEDAISLGLPFWSIDPEAAVQKRRKADAAQQQANTKTGGSGAQLPKLSERVLEKIVAEKRAKINLAEEVLNLSASMGGLLERIQQMLFQIQNAKTPIALVPQHRINEYLISYKEFKYYHLIHVIERLLDTYYQKGAAKEVKFLTDLHASLTRRDHVKITFKHNAFHVNAAYTRPDAVSLESSNYFGYYSNNEEETGFQSCIQPTVNEKALNPPQITLLEGIYGVQLYKFTQYAGQIPHHPSVYPMLDTAFINMNEQERGYINSTLHSVKMLVKDYLDVIHKEKLPNDTFEEGANLDQLKKATRFLADLIKARQLKVALMCWISSSTLPLDPKVYNFIFQQYKNDIFWKIMNKKDSLPPVGGLKALEQEVISTLQAKGALKEDNTNKKAEGSMIQNQQLMMMQAQVLVEQVQTCKAEIMVLTNELHRNIIKSAISAIESETAAIANCFTLTAKPIEQHIHPFQQFASTLYSKVDPNSHLDMVNKLSEVQRFITKLQNRGTEVETLTSGPGMVFTIKDFNECIQILCRGLIKYSEREMRARSENFAKKEAHYINMLYVKDRKIENLEQRIANTQENLDKLINSKMYEKGNQLIYELDNVNRQLKLFKDNVYIMEKELNSKIRTEFQESIRRQRKEIDHAIQKFKDYRTDVTLKVNADISTEKDLITKEITKRAEDYKNKEKGQEVEARMSPMRHKYLAGSFKNNSMLSPGGTGGGKSPTNGKSFTSTAINGYLQEIDNMTEIEARQELAEMWKEMRTLRIFWKTKEMITKDKYEREIFILKKQLTSNACLWEQLAEAEKREKVLKQELVFTQQSLAASEKVIDKLKDDLRKSESDRIRLSQYKTSKAQRLEELESKVRKFEVMDNINLEKLIDALGSKEKQIQKLKEIEQNFHERIDVLEKKKDHEIKDVKHQYIKELGMKKEVLERLEGLRMELRLLEKNEGSMTEVWKSKCKELVDICNKLKVENDQLRNRITNIANNLSSYGGGITTQSDQEQPSYRQQLGGYESTAPPQYTTLPKLMANTNRVTSNVNQGKYGTTNFATAGHTRQNSISGVGAKQDIASIIMSPVHQHNVTTGILDSRSKDQSTVSKQIRGRSTNESSVVAQMKHGGSTTDHAALGVQKQLSGTINQSIPNKQVFGILGQSAQISLNSSSKTGAGGTLQQMRISPGNNIGAAGSTKMPTAAETAAGSVNAQSIRNSINNGVVGDQQMGKNYSFRVGNIGIDQEQPSTNYNKDSDNNYSHTAL